ncbi:MAG: polyhydroxyalkanoate synthesis regulator DNA-binding domain-containing protein [Nitrososphaerales archaeon]
MPVVKRYPNRKLYDTAAKQYVSLEGVADMIRRGEPVQVIDHASGEDHTTLVLTQIIVEQEKRGTGFLPLDVLTGLVEAGGNTLATLRQRLTVPLDVLRQVDDEIQARIEKLVSLGELAEDEGRRLAQKLVALGAAVRADRVRQDEALERALRSRGVPTRDDLERLSQAVDQLSAEVESLRQNR